MRPIYRQSTEILQKHAINAVLDQRGNAHPGGFESCNTEVMTANDLFSNLLIPDDSASEDLNSEEGMKRTARSSENTFSLQGYGPLTSSSTQYSYSPGYISSFPEFFQFDNVALTSAPKAQSLSSTKAFSRRNIHIDYSTPLRPKMRTIDYNPSFKYSPLKGASSLSHSINGISNDSAVDSKSKSNTRGWNNLNCTLSRSNSPESQISNQSTIDIDPPNLLEMINMLSLAEQSLQLQEDQNSPQSESSRLHPTEPTKYSFENNMQPFETLSNVNLELAKLQNLRTLTTLQLLQDQSEQHPILDNLLKSHNKNSNGMRTCCQRPQSENSVGDAQLDRVAKFYRNSASIFDATCTWSGPLPPRSHRMQNYSPKVFLGGIPWDISEQSLIQIFKPFGQIRVEWPGKEHQTVQPKGYAYIIFESDKQVKALLSACILHMDTTQNSGIYYFKISSRRIKAKDVEVKPWIIADSNYVKSTSQKLDPTKTVFVGALHGKLTAEGLAKIMDDLFDGVLYAGIDTDKYKYPIGSGRVTFNNNRSYMKAVSAAFIEVRTCKFTKKVQVNPYLEDSLCSICGVQHGPYFCRELSCFRYFCMSCWQWQHSVESVEYHKPLTRNSKSQTIVGISAEVYPPYVPSSNPQLKAQYITPKYTSAKPQFHQQSLFSNNIQQTSHFHFNSAY